MKQKYKIFLLIAVVLTIVIIGYIGIRNEESANTVNDASETEQSSAQTQQSSEPPKRYFAAGSDSIMIDATSEVLYTDNPTTSISYYALDSSGQLVHFKSGDKAFVRVLGVTRLYTDNVEISHPISSDGSVDDTIFTGDITIPESGKYLVKVCLGPSINLDSDGTMIWPFGCYDSETSEVIDIYDK